MLKFDQDRLRWKYWLYQARKRFGLSVLNYIVTCNHIHLLVRDIEKHSIAKSMQLISGRVGQEYNQRKSRQGAFWEDCYFATAICSDEHLFQCLVYIELNMVRAGIVSHPSQWKVSGYNEIQSPPVRYTFPFPLRFLLAAELQALTAVLAVVQRAISTFMIRQSGLTVACGARSGAVTLIQRFGSALNLNIHLHMLFLDGAYRFRGNRATFHRTRQPDHARAGPATRHP